MIKTIEVDGKQYKIIKGKFYDEHFITPPRTELIAIYDGIIKRKELFSDDELYQFAMDAKVEGCYHSAFDMITELEQKLISSYDISGICKFAPIKTSLYRSLGRSEEAIEYFDNLTAKYGSRIVSGALYTSIAAAFCDTHDYKRAEHYASRAYALGGGSMELSAVYGRINRELNG